ncbi:MAG: ArnT family glycosyltransferase [Erythrobacter sp.]
MFRAPRRFAGWSSYRGALAVILLAALAIRLHSISFGLPAITDPDELTFVLGAVRMVTGGQLNPEWFGHPATTTMYMLAIVAAAVLGLGLLTGRFTDFNAMIVAGYNDPGVLVLPQRIGIALFAVLGIVLAYRLASRLFDRQTGLITAAILALSPVHIHYSQLIRSDMMATTFMLATMLSALAYSRSGEQRALVGAAVGTALAITTKWPFALSFLAVLGALVLRRRSGSITGPQATALALMTGAGTLAVMVLISPFLLIDFQLVIANLSVEVQPHHLGATGGGLIENAWWYASDALDRALGWLGLALALIGLWLVRRQQEVIMIVLLPAAALFLLACSQNIVWERWVLPVVPVLAMLTAHAVVQAALALRTYRPGPLGPAIAAAAVAALLLPLLLGSLADGRERMNDTRLMASAWLRQNAAPGSTIFVEHFAFDLVDSEFDFTFPLGAAGCKSARALISSKVDNAMVTASRKGRTNIDLGTVEPALLGTCRSDYVVLSQYSRYIAEKDRFPREAAVYQRYLEHGEKVAAFMPARGVAGGWPVVILRMSDQANNAIAPAMAPTPPVRP